MGRCIECVEISLTLGYEKDIVAFESQVYAAQVEDKVGGRLDGPDGAPGLGPQALADGAPARLGGDGLCMAMGERWRGAVGRGAGEASRGAKPLPPRGRSETSPYFGPRKCSKKR